MKKVLWVLPIILFMFFESCNEDFNINAPYKDVYTLNCILRNNYSIQYAIISKNVYTENGTLPVTSNINQNIKGADIKIFYNDSVFVMRDTTIELTNYGSITSINCYYVTNLNIDQGKTVSIEAVAPNGEKLKSKIQIPKITYYFLLDFPMDLKPYGGDIYEAYHPGGYYIHPHYYWGWSINNKEINNSLNFPQVEIYYKKYKDGIYVDKKKLVPLSYYSFINEDDEVLIPVDSNFSFNKNCYTTLKDINKAMNEISGDDPSKKNYIITKVLFSVTAMDPDLSKYYSAYNVYSEDFTIKLRQTDYSNIEGGKGIFGAYYEFSQSLKIDKLYVTSFGYQYEPSKNN